MDILHKSHPESVSTHPRAGFLLPYTKTPTLSFDPTFMARHFTPIQSSAPLPTKLNITKENGGTTFEILDGIAMQETDMESGRKTQQARKELFTGLFTHQGGALQLR